MGDNSGGPALTQCWNAVKKILPEDQKKKVARKFIKAFNHMDFHPMYEAEEVWLAAGHEIERDEE
jgi:hypothetical protein